MPRRRRHPWRWIPTAGTEDPVGARGDGASPGDATCPKAEADAQAPQNHIYMEKAQAEGATERALVQNLHSDSRQCRCYLHFKGH